MTQSHDNTQKVAVITGASSGIGAAAAAALAQDGWHVIVAARRKDKIEKVAADIGGTAIELDVSSDDSVANLEAQISRVDLLVNNAGGARGLDPVAGADLEDWQWMFDVNVLGTVRVTK
ncbi:MAG: SDR family NAD(P)-dependent oxidoreductase, partial [Brevibacterium sp.]|nr:SDR family NAD(P)-dependent oxidoreductase [Brevibacterium sp.]